MRIYFYPYKVQDVKDFSSWNDFIAWKVSKKIHM